MGSRIAFGFGSFGFVRASAYCPPVVLPEVEPDVPDSRPPSETAPFDCLGSKATFYRLTQSCTKQSKASKAASGNSSRKSAAPESGTYELEARVRPGAGGGGTFVADFDGTYSTGALTVSATDVWQNPKSSVYLPAGTFVMRVSVTGATDDNIGWNMNWLKLTKTQAAQAVSAPLNVKALAEPWGIVQTGDKDERPTEQWTGQVRLSWDVVAGADGYFVERSTDGLTWTNARVKTRLADGSLVDITNGATVTTFSDTGNYPGTAGQDNGVQPGEVYFYRVTALGSVGNRTSDVIRVKIPEAEITSVPARPTNVSASLYSASPDSGAIEVTWNNVATNSSGFWIERSTNGAAYVRLTSVGPLAAAGGTNRFLDTDVALEPDNTYRYQVRSYNWLGESSSPTESAQSVPIPSTVTAIPVGDAPTNFAAETLKNVSGANGAVRFTWIDNSDTEAGFLLQKAGQTFAVVEANVTSYIHPSFSAATE